MKDEPMVKYMTRVHEFVDRCVAWRQKHELSQKEIASRSGVNPVTVCRFEKHQRLSWQLIVWYIERGVRF